MVKGYIYIKAVKSEWIMIVNFLLSIKWAMRKQNANRQLRKSLIKLNKDVLKNAKSKLMKLKIIF